MFSKKHSFFVAVLYGLLIIALAVTPVLAQDSPDVPANGPKIFLPLINGNDGVSSAQVDMPTSSDLIITGVFDGPLTGGIPKAVEVYVANDILDLSIYGLGAANNGGGSDGEEFTFPTDSATAGSFIYVATESPKFTTFFGFAPDYTSTSAASINGDDTIELFMSGSVVDVFGDINTDGTNEPWEYLDGWAYRVNNTGPDGSMFVLANWTFSGKNALDGETTNASATTPFPIGTYSDGSPGPVQQLLLSEIVVTPTGGEFVEIYNPNSTDVDLSNVYLTDATFAGGGNYYYNIVTGSNAGGGGFGDFFARFPDGATIGAGEYQTIALAGSDDFFGEYNDLPDYELYEDGTPDTIDEMREAYSGSINDQGGLTNSGEVVILFQWDGASDLVTDFDYAVWGDKVEAVDKTGIAVDGPDADGDASTYLDDTTIASQAVIAGGGHSGGNSWMRDDLTEGAELKSGGNGAGGHDETSEDLGNTWCEDDPTPNAANSCVVSPPAASKIHEIQGTGESVVSPGTTVTAQAIVVGDFQADDQLDGFFIQEEDADADAEQASAEGIFVYCDPCAEAVAVGDLVTVTGVQEEYFGMSQIDATGGSISVVSSGNTLPTPATVDLPMAQADYEKYEGMLVTFVDTLTVGEYFELARYGQIVLTEGGRIEQFTNANAPDAAGYIAHLADKEMRTVILDDDNNIQNAPLDFTPPHVNDKAVYHPTPGGFGTSNFFRGGDTIDNLTGVLHWSFAGQPGTDAWRIRPVIQAYNYNFTSANQRPTNAPDVGGNIQVASFNVLNYFNGDGLGGGFPTSRGADSTDELKRQTDKIVAAILAMDADVVGLMEIENDYVEGANSAIASLVTAINTADGAGTYAYIDPGSNVGGDEIAVGFIYKPASVTPTGSPAILDDPAFVDPNNTGNDRNRAAIAQTFTVSDSGNPNYGARFTTAVNHLKSKGTPCGAGDDEATTGQGNCNVSRTLGAAVLANWLTNDPTNSGDTDFLIIGDLNAYAMEDPITALKNVDFIDLIDQFSGGDGYSYVFNGEIGYLDHALANTALAPQVTGAVAWHINADEVNLLDYNNTVQDGDERSFERKTTVNTLYAADEYRASDHDPIIVGLELNASPVCTAAQPSIAELWPPNHQMVAIDILGVTDAEGDVVSIVIDGIFQDEPLNASGDGDQSPDGDGIGTSTAYVRAERDGAGNGRVYYIGFTAYDSAGGSCTGNVEVSVPKSRSKNGEAVGEGPLFDSTRESDVTSAARQRLSTELNRAVYLPLVR